MLTWLLVSFLWVHDEFTYFVGPHLLRVALKLHKNYNHDVFDRKKIKEFVFFSKRHSLHTTQFETLNKCCSYNLKIALCCEVFALL